MVIDRNKVGYFEMPLIKSSHDMALWLQILKEVKFAYGINEVLAKYRLVSSSNTANKFKASMDVWRVYRIYENLNLLSSSFYFCLYVANAIKKRVL